MSNAVLSPNSSTQGFTSGPFCCKKCPPSEGPFLLEPVSVSFCSSSSLLSQRLHDTWPPFTEEEVHMPQCGQGPQGQLLPWSTRRDPPALSRLVKELPENR